MTTQGTGKAGAGAEGEGSRAEPLGWSPPGEAVPPGLGPRLRKPARPPGLKMNRSRTRQEVGVCSLACALPLGKRPARGASEWVLTAEAWLLGEGRYYY